MLLCSHPDTVRGLSLRGARTSSPPRSGIIIPKEERKYKGRGRRGKDELFQSVFYSGLSAAFFADLYCGARRPAEKPGAFVLFSPFLPRGGAPLSPSPPPYDGTELRLRISHRGAPGGEEVVRDRDLPPPSEPRVF